MTTTIQSTTTTSVSATVPANLPPHTIAVFGTLGGTVVALTKDPEAFRTSTAAFAWVCLGCGSQSAYAHPRETARDSANGHADQCRSLPMPPAAPQPPAPAPILAQVEITSFGYLHGTPPTAHITVDLRHHYRDPHVRPELRHLTAHDQTVRDTVLNTPGIPALLDSLDAAVRAYAAGPRTGPITIAVGCAGGRHRAATVASELAARIPGSVLVHRDLHQPVVER